MFHSSKRWRKQQNRKRPNSHPNTKHTKASFKGIANYAVQYSLSGRRVKLIALCVRFEFTAILSIQRSAKELSFFLKRMFQVASTSVSRFLDYLTCTWYCYFYSCIDGGNK